MRRGAKARWALYLAAMLACALSGAQADGMLSYQSETAGLQLAYPDSWVPVSADMAPDAARLDALAGQSGHSAAAIEALVAQVDVCFFDLAHKADGPAPTLYVMGFEMPGYAEEMLHEASFLQDLTESCEAEAGGAPFDWLLKPASAQMGARNIVRYAHTTAGVTDYKLLLMREGYCHVFWYSLPEGTLTDEMTGMVDAVVTSVSFF